MTLEILTGDLDDAVVYRERDNIDLLVEINSLNLVVVIENKIDAKAGEGQLERYRSIVDARYPKHRKLHIFLTPRGLDPEHSAYCTMSYVKLADIMDNLSYETGQSGAAESALIIRHYVEMLRRHIVPDNKLRELAARLYERHAEALDFIFESRPQQAGILAALTSRIETAAGLVVDSQSPNCLRLLPKAWDGVLKTVRCDPTLWTRSGRGILFEVKTYPATPGRVNVSLIIGPAAPDGRIRLYEAAKANPELFTGIVKPMGAKWATIFSRDLLTSAQAKGLTLEQQVNNVLLGWSDFQGDALPKITQAVVDIDASRLGT